jgi:arsenate reductase
MAAIPPKPRVLFLCTGNSCRSQMAEALLRHRAGEQFEAFSAGLEPKPIHPLTAEVMSEKGIDTSAQRSKDVTEYLGRERFEYVIIVCDGANRACPSVFPGARHRLFWPFEDPAAFEGSEEETLEKFRQVRDRIDARIQRWLEELPES